MAAGGSLAVTGPEVPSATDEPGRRPCPRAATRGAAALQKRGSIALAAAILLVFGASGAPAVEPEEPRHEWSLPGMAQEIRNPIAQVLQFPVEFDGDGRIGSDREGDQVHVDLKSIVPIPLGPRWTLIAWTKVPIYWQQDVAGDSGTQVGLANPQLRLFVSPAKVRRGLLERGFIWGLGPMLEFPSTNRLISAEQTSVGAVGSTCWQGPRWSVGMLAYQVFGVAGPGARSDQAYLQPFLAYTNDHAWSATVNTESTYDWSDGQWEVPINLELSKLVRLGGVHLSFLVGARYWAADTDAGPHGWGGRASLTIILPNVLESGS